MTRSDLIVAEGRCVALDRALAQARSAMSLSQTLKAERHVAEAVEAAREIIALLGDDAPDHSERRSFFDVACLVANDDRARAAA